MPTPLDKHVLVTGVTGFVGKVLLEELIRQREALGIREITVLIRPNKKTLSPQERFNNEVKASPCFARLGRDCFDRVSVVAGDLAQPVCDVSSYDQHRLFKNVTHIINCAASVDFTLPAAEALEANITTSLNMLELARQCRRLEVLVHVSTAYVAPLSKDGQSFGEELVRLKRTAREIYHDIIYKTKTEAELLRETGHPNTYTLTKCLAEHLMTERRGDVPLVFARPSIVAPCWRYPFPGWVDSAAAFAGFVTLIGAGYLRTLVARPESRLDMIPCDEVAGRLIQLAFALKPRKTAQADIRHLVAGKARSISNRQCIDVVLDFFKRYPVYRLPRIHYVGERTLVFRLKEWQHQRLPGALVRTWHAMRFQKRRLKQVNRLLQQLRFLNASFPYFTQNTFDFASSIPFDDKNFNKEAYLHVACRGIYRHLMGRRESELVFAGCQHRDGKSDFRWAFSKRHANWAIRLFGYVARKGFRRCADQITFDRPSFEAAIAAIDKKSLTVIIPNHRSYADFVLCSYLFFAHPDLGVAIPHIAAAEEFSRIPVLGWLFKKTNAFYIKRGLGRADGALMRQVGELVAGRRTLEFFIEGTRSRSRRFLEPKRGMLKCLKGTGQKVTILPIALTYDRVPEEMAFVKELRGGKKPQMKLRILLAWLGRLLLGKVKLGRIHISCGRPLTLDRTTDVPKLGRAIVGELQRKSVVTTHHLKCFLKRNPIVGVDLPWLKNEIYKRGGMVLETALGGEDQVPAVIERTMRYQWIHLFYPDAQRLYPEHPAIAHHISQNAFAPMDHCHKADRLGDVRWHQLIRTLFEPVCRDYYLMAESLGSPAGSPLVHSPHEIAQREPRAHLPDLEGAFGDLIARGIIVRREGTGEVAWGPRAEEIYAYKAQCLWPEEPRARYACRDEGRGTSVGFAH